MFCLRLNVRIQKYPIFFRYWHLNRFRHFQNSLNLHRRSLPVRGQRTQTNARTRKGPRKTVGVQRAKDGK